jgi:hypothetical protein
VQLTMLLTVLLNEILIKHSPLRAFPQRLPWSFLVLIGFMWVPVMHWKYKGLGIMGLSSIPIARSI